MTTVRSTNGDDVLVKGGDEGQFYILFFFACLLPSTVLEEKGGAARTKRAGSFVSFFSHFLVRDLLFMYVCKESFSLVRRMSLEFSDSPEFCACVSVFSTRTTLPPSFISLVHFET
jgi:hypothetical protein